MGIVNITIVGMKYLDDVTDDEIKNIKYGNIKFSSCSFEAEPHNKHDKNAIAFYNGKKRIGYVSKDQTSQLQSVINDRENYQIVPGKRDKFKKFPFNYNNTNDSTQVIYLWVQSHLI